MCVCVCVFVSSYFKTYQATSNDSDTWHNWNVKQENGVRRRKYPQLVTCNRATMKVMLMVKVMVMVMMMQWGKENERRKTKNKTWQINDRCVSPSRSPWVVTCASRISEIKCLEPSSKTFWIPSRWQEDMWHLSLLYIRLDLDTTNWSRVSSLLLVSSSFCEWTFLSFYFSFPSSSLSRPGVIKTRRKVKK